MTDFATDLATVSRPALIASASEDTRVFLNSALHTLGVRFEIASDASVALERMAECEYALLFVCTSLGEVDAFELLRLVHGDRSLRSVPKILLTGAQVSEAVVHRAYAVGCLDCIELPCRQGMLRAKIQALLAMQVARYEAEARSQRLERSNRDFAHLAHAAAHDLRAPIRTVRGFAELLKKRLVGPIAGHADSILQVAHRLDRMLTDMLEYANVDGAPGSMEPIDLTRCVETALVDLRSQLDAAQGQLKRGPLPTIIGSKSQWIRVFQNLIANSIKYARKDVPPRIHVRATLVNGTVEIRFGDNGTGFDMERHDEVFLPFRRLVATEGLDGVGVGLATVRRIVERHNGSIRAESEIGVGTTFVIAVPVSSFEAARLRTRLESVPPKEAAEEERVREVMCDFGSANGHSPERARASSEVPVPAHTERSRILVVDDSEVDRMYATALLGDNILTSSAGIGVVLSDYQMPDHDGLWLLDQVAKRHPRVKRFLISSEPDAACRAAHERGLIQRLFTKPLTYEEAEYLRSLR